MRNGRITNNTPKTITLINDFLTELIPVGEIDLTVQLSKADNLRFKNDVRLVGLFYEKQWRFYVTSDFIADCFEDCWQQIKIEFPEVQTLMIHQDNGPENHSRRTQFMARMVQWSDQSQLSIRLAYYPPYHSKYNPIECVWGELEQHWDGSLLDHLDVVVGFAKTMKWKGSTPLVRIVTQVYETGKKLTQKVMDLLEQRFEREARVAKWFVTLRPLPFGNE